MCVYAGALGVLRKLNLHAVPTSDTCSLQLLDWGEQSPE